MVKLLLFVIVLEYSFKFFHLKTHKNIELSFIFAIFNQAEETLIQKGYHSEFKFFLRKDLPKEDKDRVREIAKKRNAKVVEIESEASHVVYPSADPDNDAYCKAIFRRGEKCLVHFYRMPESHDNWGLVRDLTVGKVY